jgi:hypothetical protein
MIYVGATVAIVGLLVLWGYGRKDPFEETEFEASELPDEPSRWPE